MHNNDENECVERCRGRVGLNESAADGRQGSFTPRGRNRDKKNPENRACSRSTVTLHVVKNVLQASFNVTVQDEAWRNPDNAHLHLFPVDDVFTTALAQSPLRLKALLPFHVRFLKGNSTKIDMDVAALSGQTFSSKPAKPRKS